MNEEIAEIKALLLQQIAIAKDTNRTIHSLRRTARWSHFFQFIWWGAIIVSSAYAYYFYLQPYVASLEGLYTQVTETGKQAKGFQENIQGLLKQAQSLVPSSVPTPAVPSQN